jgi:uncharacterized repeat protein (TIGR01451 family)
VGTVAGRDIAARARRVSVALGDPSAAAGSRTDGFQATIDAEANMMILRMMAAVAAVGVSGAVAAQDSGQLNVQTVVEKAAAVVNRDGQPRTELGALEAAVPGDELIYTVIFTNISGESADNVQVTHPIPEALRYVRDSAVGPGTDICYSIDQGASFGAADVLMVQLADGGQRPAKPDDYTHIRWILEDSLEAGARGFARYRAIVR